MRGVSKPWPPADISPDGQTPRRLADAERALLADLPAATNRAVFARSTFDGLEKSKLRAVLYREQRALCVYCERRVQERYPFPPIDLRKAILNLNHPALVAARKAAIDAERARMEREFKGKTATREAREARAEALLARNPFESFVSVRTCWIRKELGKGRCEPLTTKGHSPRQ
ncbi:hypothetical protein [Candidatus Thiodictyon syntrophicum]|jgi:hypothetical protein|uniref:Uncharacterized protein n=1 Tax=Candidatus Thiodictyon syntrophicum TaxID=1166950 RepID=A0A2K8UAC8_9GAMM|nr:hypothetical protein [Candidatus Thiodictyon syntrophicum]AUB82515.1 hypothetical protein THSYN_17240 [Candidatus Thiodictyon syntrophicum]